MLITLVLVALVVAAAVVGVIGFNKLRRLNVTAEESFSQIDVQLHRRADLIPNLVETVKGYAKHESSIFEEVTKARAAATAATGVEQTAAADAAVSKALVNVMAVAENYPDLKASHNFAALQDELTTTENKIAFSRQYYNDSVSQLNTAVVTLPWMLFKGLAKVDKRDFYEVPDASARIAPNVSF